MNLRINKNSQYILFSVVGVIVILWQLLAPGYVLTLDMIFGPKLDLIMNTGSLFNTLPAWSILYFFTMVLGGWITQKLLLIMVFFLLFYFPLHFFKKIFNIDDTYGGEFVASLFFAINPFVYERFLAGHWMILLGYSLLVPFTSYLIEFCRDSNFKNGLKLFCVMVVVGVISVHIFVISSIIMGFIFLVNFFFQKFKVRFLKSCLTLCFFLLIFSSYWLLPAILAKAAPLSVFGPEHWGVFKTAGSGHFGTLGNVVSLYGFWEEHESWINEFILLRENSWIFYTSLVFFFSIIIIGIYAGLREVKLRSRIYLIVIISILAIIFSCGIGDGIFRNFNMWFFEHVYFWRGFRDSQKWSVVVALSYSLFAGLGLRIIIQKLQKTNYGRAVFYLLLVIPLFYTPMMLFGLFGQLKTVFYPDSWAEVNIILRDDKSCRAIFLPWQQYYYLKFNYGILTANLSRNYFDCDIVSGKNMELGKIRSQGGNGEEYNQIERAVMNNKADSATTVQLFKQKGIRYVIFTDDIVNQDSYKYPFLESNYLSKIFERDGVYLYKVL